MNRKEIDMKRIKWGTLGMFVLITAVMLIGYGVACNKSSSSKKTVAGSSTPPPAVPTWPITSNPGNGSDVANGVVTVSAGDDEYFIIVGGGSDQWRIEKRDLTTGALVTAFGTNGVVTSNPSTDSPDIANAVAADNSYLYIVGDDTSVVGSQWRIEKRDIVTGTLVTAFGTNGVITSNPSGNSDVPYSVQVDDNYIYIVGYDNAPGNDEWRIEKRDKTTGALVTAFGLNGVITSNPSANSDIAYKIVGADYAFVDEFYIIGYDSVPGSGNEQWRMEKRTKTTGALITAFGLDGVITSNPTANSDIAYSVVLYGDLYIVGSDYAPGNDQWRIEKRDPITGGLITTFGVNGVITSNPSADSDVTWAVRSDNSNLYVIGYDKVLGNEQWRIEKRDKTTGALVTAFGTNGVAISNPSTGYDSPNDVFSDDTNFYIIGTDYAPGNFQWRIEKRNSTTGEQ
jgi:hypothetical protein